MKIEIDTKTDSAEDIKRAIKMLQSLVGEKTILDKPLEDLDAKQAAMGIFKEEKPAEKKKLKEENDDFSDVQIIPY